MKPMNNGISTVEQCPDKVKFRKVSPEDRGFSLLASSTHPMEKPPNDRSQRAGCNPLP